MPPSPRSSEIKEQTLLQRVLASQPFWVTVALARALSSSWRCYEPSFGTADNFANMTRNFAPFGIMALGMTVVIITGGIDLSVGSVMGLVGDRRRPVPHLGISLVRRLLHGPAAGPDLRRGQRLLRRLCRHAVLRRDARHAVDRALAGGRLLRQPDALQIRARRADRQGHRPGQVAASDAGRLGPRLDPAVLLAFLGDDRAGAASSAMSSTSRPGAAISSPSAATSRRRGSPACRSTGSSSRPMCSRPSPPPSPRCCCSATTARPSTPWARATSCASSPRPSSAAPT